MKKVILKDSDEFKEVNIYSSTVNQILEVVFQNQTAKIDSNYKSVNVIEMINQIKFHYASAKSSR